MRKSGGRCTTPDAVQKNRKRWIDVGKAKSNTKGFGQVNECDAKIMSMNMKRWKV